MRTRILENSCERRSVRWQSCRDGRRRPEGHVHDLIWDRATRLWNSAIEDLVAQRQPITPGRVVAIAVELDPHAPTAHLIELTKAYRAWCADE